MRHDFSPSAIHEDLDRRGLLDDADGPGCYALRVDVPGSPEEAERRWLEVFGALPDDFVVARMAKADSVAYAGASADVYGRIMDHAEASVRRPTLLRAFPPASVVDVEPCPEPFEREWSYAAERAGGETVVWCDGELLS